MDAVAFLNLGKNKCKNRYFLTSLFHSSSSSSYNRCDQICVAPPQKKVLVPRTRKQTSSYCKNTLKKKKKKKTIVMLCLPRPLSMPNSISKNFLHLLSGCQTFPLIDIKPRMSHFVKILQRYISMTYFLKFMKKPELSIMF